MDDETDGTEQLEDQLAALRAELVSRRRRTAVLLVALSALLTLVTMLVVAQIRLTSSVAKLQASVDEIRAEAAKAKEAEAAERALLEQRAREKAALEAEEAKRIAEELAPPVAAPPVRAGAPAPAAHAAVQVPESLDPGGSMAPPPQRTGPPPHDPGARP